MLISIVISTYNKVDFLMVALKNLLLQTADREPFEVVVIVDGSTDDTIKLLTEFKANFNLTFHYKENGGLVSARNHGIRVAKGDVIVFMDDDILLDPLYIQNIYDNIKNYPDSVYIGNLFNVEIQFVKRIKRKIESGKTDIYSNMEKYCDSHPFYDAIKILFNIKNGNNLEPTVWWAVISGGNLAIPRKILNKVGGFDPQFKGWGPEDADLAYRIFKNGYSAKYFQQCKIYHLDHPRDNKKLVQSMVKYAFMLCRKYDKKPEWIEYLRFFNSLISLKEFNNNCALIFGNNSIEIDDFYMKNFMEYRAVKSNTFERAKVSVP